MTRRNANRKAGFSLVELVIVIVIIGILAAMAIPRLSRGSGGAGSAALSGNLAVVRNALNMYSAEHGSKYPGPSASNMVSQLTQFSDVAGGTSATKTGAFVFGPYLAAIPPAPVGENTGSRTVLIDATNSPPQVVTTGGEGWVYNPNTGEFLLNSTKTDDTGKAFNTY